MNIRYGLLLAGLGLVAIPALAGTKLSGPHYNLNIIGVENSKKSDMTDSNRHTIFVPLVSKTTGKSSNDGFAPDGSVIAGTTIVDSKIWLLPGDDFQVCDGNGFDEAYSCAGELMSDKKGAVFQLPCNTNLDGEFAYFDTNGDGVDDPVPLDHMVGCNYVATTDGTEVPVAETDVVPTANYAVWARALGTPGGSATVTTCATVAGELQCSLENTVQTRSTGRSTFTDVTNELTSLVVSYCDGTILDDGSCDGRVIYERVALFAGDTYDWFWNYANNGLRLAQLRFYEVE